MVQNSPEADDIELLHRAGSGDSAAFHALVDRHAQRLYRLAVSLIGNAADAEDVLQETFIGAFRGLRSFEARSSVKTWLTRILVLQAAQWNRGERRRPAGSMEDSIPAAAGSPEAAMDVQAALGRLSPEHRESSDVAGIRGDELRGDCRSAWRSSRDRGITAASGAKRDAGEIKGLFALK